jgi:hypothetical protein
MPILSGSLANVYASLDRYLAAALVDAHGVPLALRLHGVRRFVPPSEAPWVEAHYDFVGLSNRYLGLAGGRIAQGQPIGVERSGYLQLNCYQRARTFSQRYTLAHTRDIVVNAFPEGEIIPIYNWNDIEEAGGDAVQEGSLVCDGVKEHTQDTGMESGVLQHIVQVMVRYWELATRA